MTPLEQLKRAIDPRVTLEITNSHDAARLTFRLEEATVDSFETFEFVLEAYYNFHFEQTNGSRVPEFEARQRAKEIVTDSMRRSRGTLMSAYRNAHSGLNGGIRKVLDMIADGLRDEALQRYTHAQIDSIVSPASWDEQRAIVEEVIEATGVSLPDSDVVEQHVHEYKELIDRYIQNLRSAEEAFNRT